MSNAHPFDEAASGDFWNFDDDPKKPWGEFDPSDVIDVPFDWTTFLAGFTPALVYSSHTIVCDVGIEEVISAESSGIITAQIKKTASATLDDGAKYAVTCWIVCVGGQKKQMTGYLKVREM